MPVNLYYTQKVRGFQQEQVKYSSKNVEIRLKRTKHQCPHFCHKTSKRLFLSCKTIQCEQCCITNGKTFIFHLLIIRSVSGVLHICESKCFILWNDSGTMLHLKRRFMKHGFAVWSTFCACELCSSSIKIYEAPLDSGMKRSLTASCFFAQLGQKKWSGWWDSNSRPFDPQSNALNQTALHPGPYWMSLPCRNINNT